MIELSNNFTDDDDLRAVSEVVRSGWFTEGPNVARFEKAFAAYIGTKYAIATSSCTSALHLALRALGIQERDEVIVPSLSFVATANSVVYQRAKPVFAEIDPKTFCLDPDDVQNRITQRTKAIIPMHYAGHPTDMKPLVELAEDYDLYVIEDSAHAIGALYNGRRTGSLGNAGCFSFFSNKNMTCGEGGMMTTDDEEIARKARLMKTHGLDKGHWERYQTNSWRYDVVTLGFNYRMNEMEAALGISQLKKLDHMNDLRIQNSQRYSALLRGNKYFSTQAVKSNVKHVYYLYVVQLKPEYEDIRDQVIEELKIQKIHAGVHYPPIHLSSFYKRKFGYREGQYPVTEAIAHRIISLPMHQRLTAHEIEHIVAELKSVLSKY